MKTKLILSAVTALLAGVSAASAADLAARPYTKAPMAPMVAVYNWTGFYIGVNGGGAWGNSSGTLDSFTAGFTQAVADGGTPALLGAKHEGYFGGGQIGYNWQATNFVFGLEADIQGADIGRTTTVIFPGGGLTNPSVSTGRDHIDWFGTARGRVGFAVNNVLLYGTGGFAFGGVQTSVSNVYNPTTSGNFFGSSSDTRTGWAAGAGIEWGFAPNWTVKGEYLHIDLGSSNTTIVDPVNFPAESATYRFHHELDTARIGVNYKFGGPVVAKY